MEKNWLGYRHQTHHPNPFSIIISVGGIQMRDGKNESSSDGRGVEADILVLNICNVFDSKT